MSKMNAFVETLQDLLREKGLSRLALAKTLGVASSTLNGYFNMGYYPTIEIACKLSDYFECSLQYLFGLTDDRYRKVGHSNDQFIDRIDHLLKEKKISIAKAMKDMSMSEYNYFRWKKGDFPKTQNLITIATYFDITVDYLVGRSDEY